MIYPIVDLEKWLEKYELPKEMKCGGCKDMRPMNKPYATEDSRGVMSAENCPNCGCMSPMTGAIVNPNFWQPNGGRQ
jgi:hypothetical protein